MHSLKGKSHGRTSFVALKLDMSKAYDRLECNYILKVMEKLGFASQWIELVAMCIKLVSYKVIHNDLELGPIIPGQGLHQGCPLLLYLFILYSKGLTSLIHRKIEMGSFHGCKIN